MSTAVSRSNSGLPKLPHIEHPMSRQDTRPQSMQIAPENQSPVPGRSLTEEINSWAAVSGSKRTNWINGFYNRPISRNMPVSASLPSTPRCFSKNGFDTSRSDLSAIQTVRWETDELEVKLKEKVKGNIYEVRKRFFDHDPSNRGILSREAFIRVLSSLLDCPLSSSQAIRLLERFHISKDFQHISLTDFLKAVQPGAEKSLNAPYWLDTVQRQHQERVTLSADQVWDTIKQQLKDGTLKVEDLFHPTVVEGHGSALEEEFSKFWARFAIHKVDSVTVEEALKRMSLFDLAAQQKAKHNIQAPSSANSTRKESKKPSDDSGGIVEQFLKAKFREGFRTMQAEFRAKDPDNTGLVNCEDFMNIVNKTGSLTLTKQMLPEFFNRCSLQATKSGQVPYRDFLFRFQDRSLDGMTNRILSKISENDDCEPQNQQVDELICQVMTMFQRDFMALLADLHKLDPHDTGIIARSDFRSVVEKRFQFSLTDVQFQNIIAKLPQSDDGQIRYVQFLTQFDGRGMAPSLFTTKESVKKDSVVHRSVSELDAVIVHLLQTRFMDFVHAFEKIDHLNTNRIGQEDMYKLLKGFNIQPEVSRESINELWKTFILNERNSLNFWELLRHYIYDKATAAYPNAKVSPPKIGDVDVIRPSQRMTGLNTHIAQTLRSNVNFRLSSLRDQFQSMDPGLSGCVTCDQFQSVLLDMCPNLSSYELQHLCQRFQVEPGKVSYKDCLKPFALRRLGTRSGDTMLSIFSLPNKSASVVPCKDIHPFSENLIKKFKKHDIQRVQKCLKRLDSTQTGTISVGDLRQQLESSLKIHLNEDDVFEIMCRLDTNMSGKINLRRFLSSLRIGKMLSNESVAGNVK